MKLPPPDGGTSSLVVGRVGRTLLIVDRDRKLRAFDLATGRARWDAPAGESTTLTPVASASVVATTRCDDGLRCVAEARSVADGRVRWSAPLDSTGDWLGSPPVAQSQDADRSVWPAGAVIVRVPPKGERYEVRRLATGEVIARGVANHEAVGVIGNRFLRQTTKGDLTATDVNSGEPVWKHPAADRLTVARAPDRSLRWLGIPDGSLLVTSQLRDTEDLTVFDHLRIIDPRTGTLVDHLVGELRSGTGDAVPADGPAVTAESAGRGIAPRVPVLWNSLDEKVVADGRLYHTGDLGPRSVAVTATQLGWEPDEHPFAGGERDGVEVYDRRSGKRVVRYAGEDDAYARSEGERIVIRDHGREFVVKP